MSGRIVIGLAGRAGAGKDTAATALRSLLPPHESRIVAFSSALKRGLKAMTGVDVSKLTRAQKEAPHFRLGNRSPREAMQLLGTEWGRNLIHDDLWVIALNGDVYSQRERVAIVTDVRFPNEARWVRRMGGQLWWVERDGIPPVTRHVSEDSLGPMDCDQKILNAGSLADLKKDVWQAWGRFMAQREAV